MASEKAHQLAQVLQQIKKRYNSVFFSKLVLLEDQDIQIEGHIRHYDIECEAASNLVDILQTKIKANMFKSFYLIKNYQAAPSFSKKNLDNSRSKTNVQPLRYEPRAFGNTLSTANFTSRPYFRQGSFKGTKIFEENLESNFDMNNSIHGVMSKVQTLSMKMQKRQSEQNNQNQVNLTKMQKRELIMSKLAQLQNDLSCYLQQENYQQQELPHQSVRMHRPSRSFATGNRNDTARMVSYSRNVGCFRNL